MVVHFLVANFLHFLDAVVEFVTRLCGGISLLSQGYDLVHQFLVICEAGLPFLEGSCANMIDAANHIIRQAAAAIQALAVVF